MAWNKLRTAATDSVETLGELLGDLSVDDRRLVSGYLDAKRTLAAAFEAFSVGRYGDPTVITRVKAAIEADMARRYPDTPAKYLRVRGYGESHARLLAYLVQRVGSDVAADELRMLTRDAVHTERRARELRDLGFDLDARHTGGSDVYVLQNAEPDLAAASVYLIAKNVKNDRSLDAAEAEEIMRMAGLATGSDASRRPSDS